ncbi:hypothetical protein B7P43_G16581, partial [Cryptotermes secundus]
MVVEQLMTQLEEEASPEHKAISQTSSNQKTDHDGTISHQIHSDIFTQELGEYIEPLVPESKNVLTTVKHTEEGSQEDGSEDDEYCVGTISEIMKVENETDVKSKVITDVPKKCVQKAGFEKEDKKRKVDIVQETGMYSVTEASSISGLAKKFEKDISYPGQEVAVPDLCAVGPSKLNEFDAHISGEPGVTQCT